MARTKPWVVSDELWKQVRPLIPSGSLHAKGGRQRMEDRKAFEAIVYVLRTGIQWNALPRDIGASSTVHDRFQAWERAGFFKALWQAGLNAYGDLAGIPWESQAVDGANRHDVKLLSATLDGLVIIRPESSAEQPQHLCLDAAYDSTPIYQELVTRHYQLHVRSRGEERNERKRSLLAIELVVGWWNGVIHGSIVRAVSSFGGTRRWRIIWLSFTLRVLN